MSNEYTPTTEEVRAAALGGGIYREAEFNRWLDDVVDRAFAGGLHYSAGVARDYIGHPYHAAKNLSTQLRAEARNIMEEARVR